MTIKESTKENIDVAPEAIVAYLQDDMRGRPLTIRALADHFGIQKGQMRAFQQAIKELAGEGRIAKLPGRQVQGVERTGRVTGRFQAHAGGFGFIIPDDGKEKDLFISPPEARGLMDGDRVVAEVLEAGRRSREGERKEKGRRRGRGRDRGAESTDRRRSGRVVEVLERASRDVVGLLVEGTGAWRVIPDGRRMSFEIYIQGRRRKGVRPGQIVVARISEDPDQFNVARGKIIEVLGDADDPDIDATVMTRKFQLAQDFPKKVLAESQKLPRRITASGRKGRIDLRDVPTVTIDGETAKDFDDAVSVSKMSRGRTRLLVSIADVGHFVPVGSATDREALRRGTSVYFPGEVVPMLPPALSDHLCSLRPSVNRLTLTVEMIFGKEGERMHFDIFPSLIRSDARLTYIQVGDVLSSRRAPKSARLRELAPLLRKMEKLALKMREQRRERGSLDFDLPEPEIVLDLRGRVENIVKAERTVAHQIIEEFMIAANEAVAEFLLSSGVPAIHRAHEKPDSEKMKELGRFLGFFGLHLKKGGGNWKPGDITRVLQQAEGRPEEALIYRTTLRAMKQARYCPDALGHFGLASEMYTHFTSPIRRYPDLVVHRIIKELLAGGGSPAYRAERLGEIAAHASARERLALDAEREIIAVKKTRFMKERIGEEFPGIIAEITRGGIRVDLIPYFIDGRIPLGSMTDDFYMVDEPGSRLVGKRSRRTFRVGDQVLVQAVKADVLRRDILFALISKVRDTSQHKAGERRKKQR